MVEWYDGMVVQWYTGKGRSGYSVRSSFWHAANIKIPPRSIVWIQIERPMILSIWRKVKFQEFCVLESQTVWF